MKLWQGAVGAIAAAALLFPVVAGAAPAERQFTTVIVEPLVSPRPVLGADGKVHLAYELSFVNDSHIIAEVTGIAALDARSGAVLAEWKGDDLARVFRISGGDEGVNLAASHSAFAFLDVPLEPSANVPKALRHRISVTRLMPEKGGDPQKGVPLDPSLKVPGTVTFEGAVTPVDRHPAVRLQPPLRGPGWVAMNGCCDEITSHRGSEMAFDGKGYIPERFAIDFIQLDKSGKLFEGPGDKNESYPFFGVPVYAGADGRVVGTRDGMAEDVPGPAPTGLSIDDFAGNHIVLDVGGGNYVLYAHLKTGTVGVKVGDQVKAGQVLARLGNTGNSNGPHLHFHVMDGPWPLASSGLPYTFTRFTGAGRITPDEDLFEKGGPAKIDKAWNAGPHRNALPLNNEVVDFPG